MPDSQNNDNWKNNVIQRWRDFNTKLCKGIRASDAKLIQRYRTSKMTYKDSGLWRQQGHHPEVDKKSNIYPNANALWLKSRGSYSKIASLCSCSWTRSPRPRSCLQKRRCPILQIWTTEITFGMLHTPTLLPSHFNQLVLPHGVNLKSDRAASAAPISCPQRIRAEVASVVTYPKWTRSPALRFMSWVTLKSKKYIID